MWILMYSWIINGLGMLAILALALFCVALVLIIIGFIKGLIDRTTTAIYKRGVEAGENAQALRIIDQSFYFKNHPKVKQAIIRIVMGDDIHHIVKEYEENL